MYSHFHSAHTAIENGRDFFGRNAHVFRKRFFLRFEFAQSQTQRFMRNACGFQLVPAAGGVAVFEIIALALMILQFHVGQTVFLRPSAARSAAAGAYEIRAMLPDEGGQRRYRIKSLIEPHERVVLEEDLSD